jgi:hemolysin activation/secretion protein
VSGDSGWAGLAELRFDKPFEGALLKGYQLYAFVDSGMVWDRGKEDRGSLTSLGGGVRLSFQDGLRAGLEVAAPAGNYPASSSRGGLSFFFTLSHALRSCSDNTVLLCPSP